MDFVVEEISPMISRGYEAHLRFSRQNVIIRYKQGGQGKNKDEKKSENNVVFS